jgi:uncharacterized membrane protein
MKTPGRRQVVPVSPSGSDKDLPSPSLTTASVTAPPPKQRIASIDLVRGLIMVIMALDHTRDFFHHAQSAPTDLDHASAALFLTRLVTHLCAPTFMFLAGTSAYLSGGTQRPRAERSVYLLTRGLWLIVLDIVVMHFAWTVIDFDWRFHQIILGTLWALGWSMIALAGFIWLPMPVMTAVAGGIVLLHNLLDRWGAGDTPLPAWLWSMLHVEGGYPLGATRHVYFAYPIIPWIGVMALGYAFGASLRADSSVRWKRCLVYGIGSLAAFGVLRATNFYGDPSPWKAPVGRPHWFAALAFFNTHKYPPSLLYLLMTLGAMFLLLAAAEAWRPAARPLEKVRGALLTFGRVPLFFYFGHLIALPVLRLFDHLARFRSMAPMNDHGYGTLSAVYTAWAVTILVMYPLCVRYDAYKRAHPGGWTRFL